MVAFFKVTTSRSKEKENFFFSNLIFLRIDRLLETVEETLLVVWI